MPCSSSWLRFSKTSPRNTHSLIYERRQVNVVRDFGAGSCKDVKVSLWSKFIVFTNSFISCIEVMENINFAFHLLFKWSMILYHVSDLVLHYNDDVMSPMASQITGVSIIYLTVCSGADQRKQQCSESRHWPF